MAPADPPKEEQPSSACAESSVTKASSAVPQKAVDTVKSKAPSLREEPSRRSSWYNRTWPRKKAAPVTQVAIETISSPSTIASEVSPSVKRPSVPKTIRSPSERLTLGEAQSRRSSPAHATTSKVNAVSRDSAVSRTNSDDISRQNLDSKDFRDAKTKVCMKADKCSQDTSINSPPPAEQSKEPTQIEGNASIGSGWLGWFFRTNGETEKESSAPASPKSSKSPSRLSRKFPHVQVDSPAPYPDSGEDRPDPARRSWFQIWAGDPAKEHNVAATGLPGEAEPAHSAAAVDPASARSTPPAEMPPPSFSGDGSKTSGWVFWSRDRKAESSMKTPNEHHVGELAVSDTPSQKNPRRASVSLPDAKNTTLSETQPAGAKVPGLLGPKESPAATPKSSRATTPTRNGSEIRNESIATPTSAKFPSSDGAAPKASLASTPNLLLPPFRETFSTQEASGLLQSLSRLLGYSRSSDSKHLHRVREFPKLKSALAIGVHGYFPAPLFRTVLGQPTGTSIKFADMAAKAIRKWTENHGYSCEVKTAALEGEGRIAERVDLLWKLLLNWIDEIRKADFIMIGCHSQGVPVAMMLVAKLVSFGCVNSARIGICAMAGVSLGPFPDYKSRWIGGTAGELFDFSNPSSTVSKDYVAAIETVLMFGVRVVYVGSIDDQLVSLESSTFASLSHPHIYRAVFVDGRIHAPNFLVHLVGFALKLRNLGIQDHGLMRELSAPLAGSLYNGEGHSRIYEDDSVYNLAVEFALETNAIRYAPLSQRPRPGPAPPSASNPYILPWAVRGILEEDLVKSDLREEAQELLRQFDDWRPTTKALKDVKFRLEGVRSKL